MEIYLAKGGQKAGPFSIQQVNEFYAASHVGESDLAWFSGCQDWIPVSLVPGLVQRDIIQSPPLIPNRIMPPVNFLKPSIVQVDTVALKPGAENRPAAYFEIILMAIPVVATMLIWTWVANMNLLQSPGSTLSLILVATILGTAITAAIEASKVGMTSNRLNGTYSPTAWFFIIGCLWMIGYPIYLYKRKHFGLPNRLIIGIVLELVFMGSYLSLNYAIEQKEAELRGSLEQIEQEIDSLGE